MQQMTRPHRDAGVLPWFALGIALVMMVLSGVVESNAVSASNDFGNGLWVSPPSVANAGYYNIWIGQIDSPDSTPNTFTTGWQMIWLSNMPGLYGDHFVQVGIKSFLDPVYGPTMYWFAEAEVDVVCTRGIPVSINGNPFGCQGDFNDLVDNNHPGSSGWIDTGLVVDPADHNYWYAAVFDIKGNGSNVMYVPYSSPTIYNFFATAEEQYDGSIVVDPRPEMSFLFYHPTYVNPNIAWPSDPGNIYYGNGLRDPGADPYPTDGSCPYAATFNLNGDGRYWYVGSGGVICAAATGPVHPSGW